MCLGKWNLPPFPPPAPARVFLSLFLCVYMVRACEYVYGCLRPTMFTGGQRKSEKDICTFLYLYPITLNEGLLLNWKLTVLVGLLPSALLWFVCLCPCTNLNVGVKGLWRHACLFIWVLGIKLRSLCLHKQVLLPIFWAIFLASEMRLKGRNCLFCMCECFVCMFFFTTCVQCPLRPEEGTRSLKLLFQMVVCPKWVQGAELWVSCQSSKHS